MSDLKKYIRSRKCIDKRFAAGFEEGYEQFKFGVLQRRMSNVAKEEKAISSPDWHQDTLKERDAAYQADQMKASSWEKAKKRIRKQVL